MGTKRARKIIEMVKRRARPGSGSRMPPVREPSKPYGSARSLKEILVRTPYVIVGGLATRLYMQERMTLDTDILVHADHRDLVEQELKAGGARKTGVLTIGGSTWELPDKTILDVVILEEPWVQNAIATSAKSRDGLPYVELGYLVLMKLKASRVQDLADISRMLGGACEGALEEVRRIVKRYSPADSADLESLITLGKLEAEE